MNTRRAGHRSSVASRCLITGTLLLGAVVPAFADCIYQPPELTVPRMESQLSRYGSTLATPPQTATSPRSRGSPGSLSAFRSAVRGY